MTVTDLRKFRERKETKIYTIDVKLQVMGYRVEVTGEYKTINGDVVEWNIMPPHIPDAPNEGVLHIVGQRAVYLVGTWLKRERDWSQGVGEDD